MFIMDNRIHLIKQKLIFYFFRPSILLNRTIKLFVTLLFNFFSVINGSYKSIILDQEKIYSENNLDRNIGIKRVEKIRKAFPFLNAPMNSEHQVIK